MRALALFLVLALLSTAAFAELVSPDALNQVLKNVSPQSRACIACHVQVTPGIVYDWLNSKHAHNVPAKVYDLYRAIGDNNEKIAPKFEGYKYVVGCYECHGMFKDKDRPDVVNHFGFNIVTIVTAKDCSQCHPKEAREISWTWHGFAALNAVLKPWYAKIVKYAKETGKVDEMLPPVYKLTGKAQITWEWYKQYAKKIMEGKYNDPEVKMFGTPYDKDFKDIVSPLFPASGVLANTVAKKVGFSAEIGYPVEVGKYAYKTKITAPMEHPGFHNAYVYHACIECHGGLVVPYKVETKVIKGYPVTRVDYWGWPSNGAGRVDPDGSLGTCTACHPRHTFSVEQAREPWTCGQCHLGYDHPHIEMYEESKHGNIFTAYGSKWNMEHIPWRVGVDFNAPTCATCHMSTIATPDGRIIVKGTHDLRARLVWDQMHFFAYPKPKWPDLTQNLIIKGASQLTGKNIERVAFEGYKVVSLGPKPGELKFPRLATIEYYGELKKHREAMMQVCEICHSTQWVENYFRTADNNLLDYDIVAHYAKALLDTAYKLGIQDPKNKLDEYMEIQWYYIWHHQGRRWRNGAYMMGPDYAHWFGIVDTVMEAVGKMLSYYQMAVQMKQLEAQVQALAK